MQTSAQTVDGPSLVSALLIVVHDCDCVVLLAQVRITAQNKVRNYITYAMALLEEKGYPSVVLKAMGKAINKAVVVGMSLATNTSHAATRLKLAQPWMSDVAAHVRSLGSCVPPLSSSLQKVYIVSPPSSDPPVLLITSLRCCTCILQLRSSSGAWWVCTRSPRSHPPTLLMCGSQRRRAWTGWRLLDVSV